ncbi:glycosyltransferase [Solihabitans fulvus]|uniref:Glycosyltransferase n=1 Tax=Solihabitans fulvus TaxID=1892852 RepID=A0A5B2XF07_9PSEU|nr:glycosyltransferase [Solihabitans fulvus]KAA2261704.1 glycosyltransferase [Solihabitans fulvus]
MTREPAVSICLPAYQAERYIAEAVRSVLAQSWRDFELVVLDNACTDQTAAILRSFDDPRLRIVRNDETVPLPENWNRVVRLASGELIKVLCADDLIHPDALARQVAAFRSDATLALAASRRHVIDESGVILAANRGLSGLLGRFDGREVARRVVRSGANPIGEPAGVMFRREHFEKVGGFDGELLFPMDLDLWMKLLRHGHFIGIGQSLAAFRVSRFSLSAGLTRTQYREQLELTSRIAEDDAWQIPRGDLLLGRARAPLAKLRRRTIFELVRLSARL